MMDQIETDTVGDRNFIGTHLRYSCKRNARQKFNFFEKNENFKYFLSIIKIFPPPYLPQAIMAYE